MPTKILIGFADALAAPECAFSLLDAGYDVVAFARRGSKPPLRRVNGVRIVEITSPGDDADIAVLDVIAIADEIGARVLMPLDDASLWLCAEASRRGTDAVIAGPTGDLALLALDKRRQLELALSAGFAVPETRTADEAAMLDPPDLPLVLKGRLAIARVDGALTRAPTFFCGSERELDAALSSWPAGQPLLAQPAITGVGEGMFGIARQGTPHATSGHRRVRMMNPRGSGSSACQSRPLTDAETSAGDAFLRLSDWDGLFMIELLRDPSGKLFFMELNGRAWGSIALARRLGLEYPAWAVRAALDASFIPEQHQFNAMLCRHAGRELVHLLVVMHGPRGSRPPGWPGRWRTVRDVMRISRADSWYNWRPGEPRFFVEDTLRTLQTQLSRSR